MIKKTLLLFFAFMALTPGMLLAENLDSLPEAKRNARLLEIAKQVVMKHGPGYYRDVIPPIIVHGFVSLDKREFPLQHFKQHEGRSYYTVEYPYDRTQEALEWYAAKTFIWGNTGIPFDVYFGNGWGFDLNPTTRSANEKEQFMPFEKRPPRVPYKPKQVFSEPCD